MALAEIAPRPLEELLLVEIQSRVDEGAELREAARAALEVIAQRGRSVELLELLALDAAIVYWRKANQSLRNDLTGFPGRRRVNIEPLQRAGSIYECLYPVGGYWIRLGDMTAEHTEQLTQFYAKLAKSNAAKAKIFKHLTSRLRVTAGSQVSQAFSEEELKALFEKEAA